MESLELNKIIDCIYIIRGNKIILDKDIAKLYNIETKALKQAVKRNIERFPDDFMFELKKKSLMNEVTICYLKSWGRSLSAFCFY